MMIKESNREVIAMISPYIDNMAIQDVNIFRSVGTCAGLEEIEIKISGVLLKSNIFSGKDK